MELCAIEIPNVLPRAAFQNKLQAKAMMLGVTRPALCSWLPIYEKEKVIALKFIKISEKPAYVRSLRCVELNSQGNTVQTKHGQIY